MVWKIKKMVALQARHVVERGAADESGCAVLRGEATRAAGAEFAVCGKDYLIHKVRLAGAARAVGEESPRKVRRGIRGQLQ